MSASRASKRHTPYRSQSNGKTFWRDERKGVTCCRAHDPHQKIVRGDDCASSHATHCRILRSPYQKPKANQSLEIPSVWLLTEIPLCVGKWSELQESSNCYFLGSKCRSFCHTNMKAACCQLILLFSCMAVTLALPWKPDISAGGSVSLPRDSSLFQKTSSNTQQQQDETLFVVKRDGRREPFDNEKVS